MACGASKKRQISTEDRRSSRKYLRVQRAFTAAFAVLPLSGSSAAPLRAPSISALNCCMSRCPARSRLLSRWRPSGFDHASVSNRGRRYDLHRLINDWEVCRNLAAVPFPYPRELADHRPGSARRAPCWVRAAHSHLAVTRARGRRRRCWSAGSGCGSDRDGAHGAGSVFAVWGGGFGGYGVAGRGGRAAGALGAG